MQRPSWKFRPGAEAFEGRLLLSASASSLATGALGLWITRSNLPRDLRRKKATNVIPEQVLDSAAGSVEP